MTFYRGQSVFLATAPTNKRSLWTTDGTAAGTRPWSANSPTHRKGPELLTSHGGRLYYFADDQIWSTDGTTRNTKPLSQSTYSGTVRTARWADDTLYFVLRTAQEDELWSYQSVAFVRGRFRLGSVRDLTPVGDRLVFVADNQQSGVELWAHRNQGAELLVDLRPGVGSSYPSDLVPAGDGLYFAATGAAGRELYFVNLEPRSLRRLTDLWPGSGNGYVSGLQFIGDDLVFAGLSPVHGSELFRVRDPRAHVVPLGGCATSGIELSASNPSLGQTVRIVGRSVPTISTNAVLLGLPTTDPINLPRSPCPLRLAANGPLLTLATPRFDHWHLGLPIPNDPALRGRSVVTQVLGQQNGTFVTSNGLRLVIGH